jgi:alpha-1,2-mannosyltransferase
MGQVNIVVLASIMLSIHSYHCKKSYLSAGLLLSPAVMIKAIPLLLIPLFTGREKTKAIIGLCFGITTLAAVSYIIDGSDSWQNYCRFLITPASKSAIFTHLDISAIWNFSIAAFFSRITNGNSALAIFLSVIADLALYAVILYHSFRYGNEKNRLLLLLPFLISMIIMSPITYLHHIIYIFPGVLYTLLFLIINPGRMPLNRILPVFAGLCILATIDFPLHYYLAPLTGSIKNLATSLNLYALLALYYINLMIFRQQTANQVA